MNYFFSFLAGLLFANGIPHFIHGISGEAFAYPKFQTYFHQIPSPLFNAIWGVLNFTIAALLILMCKNTNFRMNIFSFCFLLGFSLSSIGLSIYFKHNKTNEKPHVPQ